MATDKQRLASALLGRPVVPWVRERRNAGLTWRRIARELFDATDGKIDVVPLTLVNWTSGPAEDDEDESVA
jgi:hypothetical protein